MFLFCGSSRTAGTHHGLCSHKVGRSLGIVCPLMSNPPLPCLEEFCVFGRGALRRDTRQSVLEKQRRSHRVKCSDSWFACIAEVLRLCQKLRPSRLVEYLLYADRAKEANNSWRGERGKSMSRKPEKYNYSNCSNVTPSFRTASPLL